MLAVWKVECTPVQGLQKYKPAWLHLLWWREDICNFKGAWYQVLDQWHSHTDNEEAARLLLCKSDNWWWWDYVFASRGSWGPWDTWMWLSPEGRWSHDGGHWLGPEEVWCSVLSILLLWDLSRPHLDLNMKWVLKRLKAELEFVLNGLVDEVYSCTGVSQSCKDRNIWMAYLNGNQECLRGYLFIGMHCGCSLVEAVKLSVMMDVGLDAPGTGKPDVGRYHNRSPSILCHSCSMAVSLSLVVLPWWIAGLSMAVCCCCSPTMWPWAAITYYQSNIPVGSIYQAKYSVRWQTWWQLQGMLY